MKSFLRCNNSDKLLLFFTGWGCDEKEFNHLSYENDILFLFNYNDLSLDFDFSKYKNIILMAFSAGVFVSSVFQKKVPNISKRIIIDGNPYLFDEELGLSEEMVKIFKNINLDNYIDFRKKYLIYSDKELELFNKNEPNRSLDDCIKELSDLEKLYKLHKKDIILNYDIAIFGNQDTIFNQNAQKEFFKTKYRQIEKAKHNIFYKFNSFEEILNIK